MGSGAEGGGALDRDAVRTTLMARREQLLDRVRRLDKDVHHRETPLPADFAEQAVELENQEVMEALDDDARAELREIDRALGRIESGDYGTCTRCGEAIAAARLEVLPAAALCIDCATSAGV
ncbi:MAG: TraR/DksA family transcriptional regulator [Pseudomonadales bacterium]|jgi:RNA polymerase-binding protein DksA|nr:TraR/DksA family transcriptional regulator [Pseudomonadales bacterium]